MDQLITILQNQLPYTPTPIISPPQQFILTPTFTALNPQPILINHTFTKPPPITTQPFYPTSNPIHMPPANILLIPAIPKPQIHCAQMNVNTNNTNITNLKLNNISRNINIPKAIHTENNPNINDINIQNFISYMLQQCNNNNTMPVHIPPSTSSMSSISPSTATSTSTTLPALPKLEAGTTCETSKEPQSCYCVTCGKHFKNRYNLLVHEKKQHEQTKHEFPTCPFCGKEFVHRGNLKQHIRTHSNKNIAQNAFQQRLNNSCGENLNGLRDKCYKCPVCFKAFSKQTLMRQHRLIHNGSKQYVCTICNSSYSSKSAQTNHMKHVHPLVWETIKHRFMFKCDK